MGLVLEMVVAVLGPIVKYWLFALLKGGQFFYSLYWALLGDE